MVASSPAFEPVLAPAGHAGFSDAFDILGSAGTSGHSPLGSGELSDIGCVLGLLTCIGKMPGRPSVSSVPASL